jgi:hypothetical protein
VAYEVPSAATADAGLEGFAVRAGFERLGRVAALNRVEGQLVVLVDTGEEYRAVPASAIERIERLPRLVELGATGFAPPPVVDVDVVRVESERLVRHIPLELERLTVDGVAPAREPRSGAWYAGVLLASVGGVGLFVGVPLALDGLGGGVLRWVWPAVPLVACIAGIALVRRSGRFGDAAVALLGISPRTRRRG